MILSIIVPVYNVEAYLNKCVGSLLDQNLNSSQYEIILVDDGSTDASGQICNDFAAVHTNIRVIHQKNGGLSSARNSGIIEAKGKFIQFVDSDDYLNADVLGDLIEKLENEDLDILRINYQNVDATGKVFEPNKYSKPFVDYSEKVCDGLTFLNERLGYACYAVQFIARASILQKKGNSFKDGIYFEDVEWTPRILLQAQRIASSPLMVYNYLFRDNSITRNVDICRKRKSINDKLSLIQSLQSMSGSVNDSRWFHGMASQLALSVLLETSRFFNSERRDIIHELRELQVFPLSLYHATPVARRKMILANCSPYLLCNLHHAKTKYKAEK